MLKYFLLYILEPFGIFLEVIFIMDVITYIVMAVQLLCAVALIAVITMQSGKNSGLSSVVGGGSETFLGKGKSKTADARLASMTKWIAGVFVLLTFILNLL